MYKLSFFKRMLDDGLLASGQREDERLLERFASISKCNDQRWKIAIEYEDCDG